MWCSSQFLKAWKMFNIPSLLSACEHISNKSRVIFRIIQHCFKVIENTRLILPLRIICPTQERSTWKVHSEWVVSPKFMCKLSRVAEIDSLVKVRSWTSTSPGPNRSNSGHMPLSRHVPGHVKQHILAKFLQSVNMNTNTSGLKKKSLYRCRYILHISIIDIYSVDPFSEETQSAQ